MPTHSTAEVKLAIDLKRQAIRQGRNDDVSLRQCLEQAKSMLRRNPRKEGVAVVG
jgi:hypothetical protein